VWWHSVAARVSCRSDAAGQTAARGARITPRSLASRLLGCSCGCECGCTIARQPPRRARRVRNVAAGWRGGDLAWGSVMLLRGVHVAAAMAAHTAAAAPTTPTARGVRSLLASRCGAARAHRLRPAAAHRRNYAAGRAAAHTSRLCDRCALWKGRRGVCGWPCKRLCAASVMQPRSGHEPRPRSLRLLTVMATARVSTFAGGSGSPLAMNAALA
jgi:hypothetical protein